MVVINSPFFALHVLQCITLVKIHCITCITLNYCLTETSPFGYRLYSRELDPQQKDNPVYSNFLSRFPFVQFACKECSLAKVMNMQHELLNL